MDPLSDVLALLKPQSYGAGAFDMAGAWSVGFPPHHGIKFYAVMSGACQLDVDGVAGAQALKTGDCFLLPLGRPFRLATDLRLSPVDYTTIPRKGGIATWNDGGECFIVGGHFDLSDLHAFILVDMLAPIVRIRDEEDKAMLRWSLERLRRELSGKLPGAELIARHLVHMVLVQLLRLHVADGERGGVGWLFALADKQVSAALNAVHAEPARGWTLQALAQEARMSRSGFALRFKELVGETPLGYVTRWRMRLASDRLASSAEPISVIARSLGYESESAFSTAFKRVMGCSPRRYARKGQPAATPEHPASPSTVSTRVHDGISAGAGSADIFRPTPA